VRPKEEDCPHCRGTGIAARPDGSMGNCRCVLRNAAIQTLDEAVRRINELVEYKYLPESNYWTNIEDGLDRLVLIVDLLKEEKQ